MAKDCCWQHFALVLTITVHALAQQQLCRTHKGGNQEHVKVCSILDSWPYYSLVILEEQIFTGNHLEYSQSPRQSFCMQ